MSETLYNAKILRLAASVPHDARLTDPRASVRKVSPVCGSRVTVDLDLDGDGRVVRFGQEVRACALGQASAAILGERVMSRTADELVSDAERLAAFLSEAATPLPDHLSTLDIFTPARPHKARHASILLSWQAAAEAAQRAGSAAAGTTTSTVNPPLVGASS
ncbi:MAG: iron-sulfur cluster assembly scaffold protein [Pacificimonas sp.]